MRSFLELLEGDRCRELADLDREIGELHLAGKDLAQRTRTPFRTAHGNPVAGDEQRDEEGKALDMIPVGMTEQDGCRDGSARARHHRRAERPGAGAAIEDEACAGARRHFHARGVAAESDRVRARRRN